MTQHELPVTSSSCWLTLSRHQHQTNAISDLLKQETVATDGYVSFVDLTAVKISTTGDTRRRYESAVYTQYVKRNAG